MFFYKKAGHFFLMILLLKNKFNFASVAQLDRALPSEGRGFRFKSCRTQKYSLISIIIHKFNLVVIAQLVECWIVIPVVMGSSPINHPKINFGE